MKEKIIKLKDNKAAIVLFILLIITLCIGISYAYWRLTLVQSNLNSLAISCFNITFREDTSAINLEKAYPISDEEGRVLTPYTFTIINECEEFANYQINLEVLEDTTLSSEYIKVLLNEENSEVLTEKEAVGTTLENASTSYKLKTGYLDAKESITYNLRLWMDYDTPAIEETMNKIFSSKITIVATYALSIPSNMLMKGPDFEIEFQPDKYYQTNEINDLFAISNNIGLTDAGEFYLLNIPSDSFWQFSNQIITINFEAKMNPPANSVYTYDVSEKQDGSILAYLVENESFAEMSGGGTWYDLYIQTDGKLMANPDFSGWFAGMSYLLQINGLENVDTSNVVDMSNLFAGTGMFAIINETETEKDPSYPYSMEVNFPINLLNTSNVTDMSSMFALSNVQQLSDNSTYISNFDTTNVENMSNMFLYSIGLRKDSIDISTWNTSKVTNMSGMFGYSIKISNINLGSINTNNVTDFSNIFAFSRDLNSLDVSKLNTEKAKDMSYMFFYNNNISSLDVSNLSTESVTNMSGMFAGLSNISELNINNFITNNVTDMSYMFAGLKVENLDLNNFNTANVTNMASMFDGVNISSLELNNFNTENVTDMSRMFSYANINSLDISSFNTENVINFSRMFASATGRNIENVVYGSNFVYRNSANVNSMFDSNQNINKPTDQSWTGII